MASILNATTTSGLVTSADNSGSLQLQTNNGTTAVTIDTSQNVGIGTASPSSYLTGVFTVASSGDNYLNIVSGNANAAGCMFQDTTGTSIVGGTRYTHSDNKIGLWANGSEQFAATSAGLFQFNSGYGSVATAYGCRAWVNFNGTSTVAIRGSGNVSSITDNGTGSYTVNLTTAMPDANYAVIVGAGSPGTRDGSAYAPATSTPTSSAFVIRCWGSNAPDTVIDHTYVLAAVFR